MWQEVEPPRDTIGYHGCIYIWNPKGIKMILKDTKIPFPSWEWFTWQLYKAIDCDIDSD